MKLFIRLAMVVGVLIAAGILFLIVVANYAVIETRLTCPGQIRREVDGGDAVTTPATLFAKMETYRWFILWADYDAVIYWEVQPVSTSEYARPRNGFGYYNHSEFSTTIWEGQKQRGSFSTLSNRIFVLTSVDETESFEGICK